jgi:Ca2+-transporting ATPase
MEQSYSISAKETIKNLETNPEKGLSFDKAIDLQKKFGKNELPKKAPLSQIKILLDQFKSPLVYVLVIAGFITLFFHLYTDAIVIFAAVFLNTIIGFFQEKKAVSALRELKKIVKIEAKVIRDGNEIIIDAEELVQGDIIVLVSGDKVPADSRLIETHNLKINEAPLTGEWRLAEKNIKKLSKNTPLADRDNMAYMGTLVETGIGRAVVTAIGQNTEIGKIAVMVKETEDEKTPLQKKISLFSKKISVVIAVLCLFIFLEGILHGEPALEMFITAVAIAVAAIPEGLPISLTVVLAMGMSNILKNKGLVRKMVSAETLGSASIIATDKTLTLTEGKMKVSELITAKTQFSFANKDWGADFFKNADKEQILAANIAVLCSEAFVENPEQNYPLWRIQGKPTDKAFVSMGARIGIEKEKIEKEFPKIDEIPFDSKNKFIAGLRKSRGENILYVSGAPEKILELSSKIQNNGKSKKISKKEREKFDAEIENFASKGLRLVAVAYKKTKSKAIKVDKEIEDLVFVGLFGMKDPLRKEVKGAIKVCRQAGMTPIIVTGDHLLTARAIAKELGFKTNKENVIEGMELDNLSDKEFQERIRDIQIYARVEPKHKLRIVDAWQNMGEVVAMTGDGINDAPALKKADIGVALGSGTDVAKGVSDLILLTDNFNIIVSAVEQGRAIIDNLRKVITYLLSDSFTETILIGVSVVLGFPLPIIAVQILYVNLIEDGLPGIALCFEPKEKDLMERRPESKDVALLTKEMKAIIFVIGIITDLILLGLFFWLLKLNYDLQYIQTMIFAALSIDSLFYIFSCRSLRRNIWEINPFSNKFLILAWIVGIIALLAALYVPFLQNLLRTVPLGMSDWLIIIALGIIEIILIEATKYHFIKKIK